MRFGSRQATAVAVVAIGSVAAFSATSPHIAARTRTLATTVNWPLHNLDLAGSRYSTLDQINRSNVKSLVPRWLFQHGVIDGVSNQTTPIIVDGTMYVTDSRGSVYAVDAADGHLLWSYDVTAKLGGGAREGYVFRNRGVTYGDGIVYAAGGSFIFALDAKTGKPVPAFGKEGQASVILDVLSQRYTDVRSAISMGYWFTTAPQYTQREPHPRRPRARGGRENGKGALALQHHSTGRERSGLGRGGPDLGWRGAQWGRHLGNGGD